MRGPCMTSAISRPMRLRWSGVGNFQSQDENKTTAAPGLCPHGISLSVSGISDRRCPRPARGKKRDARHEVQFRPRRQGLARTRAARPRADWGGRCETLCLLGAGRQQTRWFPAAVRWRQCRGPCRRKLNSDAVDRPLGSVQVIPPEHCRPGSAAEFRRSPRDHVQLRRVLGAGAGAVEVRRVAAT
jgi:hypothetical protein